MMDFKENNRYHEKTIPMRGIVFSWYLLFYLKSIILKISFLATSPAAESLMMFP